MDRLQSILVGSNDRPTEATIGIGYQLLINSEATNGAYEVMKFVVPSGLGSPLHMHTKEDECFYVIEGQFELTVGDDKTEARQGDLIHLPRNLPHAIRNIQSEMSSFLCWVTPGNLGPFFNTFTKPWPIDEKYPPMLTGEEIQKMMSVAEEYGIRVLTSEAD